MATKITLLEGNIVKQQVSAIVNAANFTLLGGGGVDGAIHKAAGPGLLAECRAIGGCMTGDAVITKGYNLRAKFVIHAVGPEWQGGYSQEEELLASAYKNSLQLLVQNNLKSIAIPAISTGAYGFPLNRATQIAVKTVIEFVDDHPEISEVIFVTYQSMATSMYQQELTKLAVDFVLKR
ncbi:O-acetyl-ADP-ribose deacetylase [Candidatus Neomarinimicrobiota bacterium]